MDCERAQPSFAERLDPEWLKANRPSWRLFHAHPALGLKETESDFVWGLAPQELGVRWLALDATEQRARERDFLQALLRRAAVVPGASFEAGWHRDRPRTADLARRCGGTFGADETACGRLTEAAVGALVDPVPQLLAVEGGDELVIYTDGDATSVGVWMDRWKAPALERELLDHVWVEAQRRRERTGLPDVRRRGELDRTLRAHLLVAWDRHAYRAFVATMALAALLGLHPWGDRSFVAVALRVAVAVVVLIVLGSLVERWYHRSDREPE
jgi:hypothetical protein